MRLSIRHPILWILLLAWPCLPVSAATGAADAREVDLGKTLALFQGWAARDSFPDTVTLAYYNAYAQRALRGEIPPGIGSRVLSFVKRCQQPDGGFVSNPKFPGKSNLTYTFYALKALEAVGGLDGIDQAKALGFIQPLIREDGSIAPSPGESDRASLASTYFGVAAMQLLGKTDLVNKEKTAAFVLGHRNQDGGFGVTPQGASGPRGVAMAVKTLAALNRLDKEIVPGAVAYLENAMAQLGLPGKRHRAFSTIQASADTLDALVAMQAMDDVQTSPIQAFVESLYVPQNGGFGPMPGYGTSPPSTFQGVYCLKILGKPPMPVVVPATTAAQSEGSEPVADQLKP